MDNVHRSLPKIEIDCEKEIGWGGAAGRVAKFQSLAR